MATQFLRPDADSIDGSWTNETGGTSLFGSIDESSASDSDYIQSSQWPVNDLTKIRLSDPTGGIFLTSPSTVRYRYKRGGSDDGVNLTVSLLQGSTTIASWTHTDVGTTYTTASQTLTAPQLAAITDATDLYLTFSASTWWIAGASVDMDFVNNRCYATGSPGAAVTDFLTCTRASTGYAKTSTGTLTNFGNNVLRRTDNGLLIEDARTNIATQSQTLDNASWQKISTTVTADQAVAPDGTTTMDLVDDGTANDRHIVWNSFNITANTAYTTSIYAKDNGRRYLQFSVVGSGTPSFIYVFADLQNGVLGDAGIGSSVAGTAFNGASIESLANGVYRISLTGVVNNSDTSLNAEFALSDRSTNTGSFFASSPQYTGSNKQLYLWGVQIEQATFPSSYIPTTSATATRAADAVTASGALQTVIAASTGSLFAQIDGLAAGFAANAMDSNGTNLLGFNSSDKALASLVATLATSNSANRSTRDKLMLGWSGAGRSLVLNGGTVTTDASAQTPSSTLRLGAASSGANNIYGYVERITAFNSKQADATMQSLTTLP